ncbi:hypothetical protein [Actinospica robiniae]|uniref:hypothetical protein n=1 Tax=Actinospica robiniae TaxID=304901 RepID=UPI0012F7B37B|nr:hypothetical protein [Actinospica robiniae]
MVADLESLIPPACLAVGFVLLIRAILRNQNPQRRAAARAREAAAEAADPRIRTDQTLPSELSGRNKTRGAKVRKADS